MELVFKEKIFCVTVPLIVSSKRGPDFDPGQVPAALLSSRRWAAGLAQSWPSATAWTLPAVAPGPRVDTVPIVDWQSWVAILGGNLGVAIPWWQYWGGNLGQTRWQSWPLGRHGGNLAIRPADKEAI